MVAVIALAPRDRASAQQPALDTLEKLGSRLFGDVNLSSSRSQACVSCHSPRLAFTDPRELGDVAGALSLGADGRSFGPRNAPTITYVGLTPSFSTEDGAPIGGLFWDGRAQTLEAQALDPPINPDEMGMPDKASVVARIKENAAYVDAFKVLFGADVFADDEAAYAGMAKALAAFERTDDFAPFDSKYDRSLRGEATLSALESEGRDLFFSERANCKSCHATHAEAGAEKEVFSNFRYHNIGTPANPRVIRALAAARPDHVDRGLLANPAVAGAHHDGKFKVPTLRNVAATAPYMHNGVFQELRTVILFHERFKGDADARHRNPETDQPWGPPEVADNLAMAELTAGSPLEPGEIDALVAFLGTLSDQRYECLSRACE
jgi:cytochrome c peroxidase